MSLVNDREQSSISERDYERVDESTTADIGVSTLQTTDQEQSSLTEGDHGGLDKLAAAVNSLDYEMGKKVFLDKKYAQEKLKLNESEVKIRILTDKLEERITELEKKEQKLKRCRQHELTQDLIVMIAREKEEIKHLKEQLNKVEKELRQQREKIHQTKVEVAKQCEKTCSLDKEIAKLKKERKAEEQQLVLSVVKNQGHLSELCVHTHEEMKSFRQEIKEKEKLKRCQPKKKKKEEPNEGEVAEVAADLTVPVPASPGEDQETGTMRRTAVLSTDTASRLVDSGAKPGLAAEVKETEHEAMKAEDRLKDFCCPWRERWRKYRECRYKGITLEMAVKLAKGDDLQEWVAFHVVDFYNSIYAVYCGISECCTDTSCPTMCAGPKFKYYWADSHSKKPQSLPARQYITKLKEWIQQLINNEEIFPVQVGVPFPRNFLSTCRKILCRLYRVFVHIYYYHFDKIQSGYGAEAHLNMIYRHFYYFVTEFDLVARKEFEPLIELTERLCPMR